MNQKSSTQVKLFCSNQTKPQMELIENEFTQFSVFHQKEELTTRIKNILDEYPTGLGPFKEFLQNADDAKAKKFAGFHNPSSSSFLNIFPKNLPSIHCLPVIFDRRRHATDGCITKEFGENHQGPALLFFNDSTFSDNDFVNITSLGKSQVRNQSHLLSFLRSKISWKEIRRFREHWQIWIGIQRFLSFQWRCFLCIQRSTDHLRHPLKNFAEKRSRNQNKFRSGKAARKISHPDANVRFGTTWVWHEI